MRGECMCGAVSFQAEPEEKEAHACHCTMCRKWTGSALLAVAVASDAIRFAGEDHIRTLQSSEWAERAWCDRCGSNLFYRITAEGPAQGTRYVSLGRFEDPGTFSLMSEIYFDRKPDSFSYAGERKTMTAAEVEAMFASLDQTGKT